PRLAAGDGPRGPGRHARRPVRRGRRRSAAGDVLAQPRGAAKCRPAALANSIPSREVPTAPPGRGVLPAVLSGIERRFPMPTSRTARPSTAPTAPWGILLNKKDAKLAGSHIVRG